MFKIFIVIVDDIFYSRRSIVLHVAYSIALADLLPELILLTLNILVALGIIQISRDNLHLLGFQRSSCHFAFYENR